MDKYRRIYLTGFTVFITLVVLYMVNSAGHLGWDVPLVAAIALSQAGLLAAIWLAQRSDTAAAAAPAE